MKKYTILSLLIAAVTLNVAAQTVTFTGTSASVIDVTPAATTGLHHIYVLNDAAGVSMSYTARSSSASVQWQDYGEQGGGYAVETAGVTRSGAVTTLSPVVANRGYIITEGTTPTYVWVTDYATFGCTLDAIEALEATECGTATLSISGTAPEIVYYSINGARRVLDREFRLTYNSLEYNDSTQWQEVELTENLESLRSTLVVPAPLCNTTFTLTGDRFLTEWGSAVSVESGTFVTRAVDVRAAAEQETRENDNERDTADDGATLLGGSAPVHIVFTGYPTDAVVYREWQMSRDNDFENIEIRMNQDEVDYTFTEAGTYYWRYVGANDDGECEATTEPLTVSIGESELLCPNVFSPGSSEGANDVWKVSYRSIIDFHCWIFNRWGNKVCEFTDPSQGWDGRYHGKLVGAGVYYYVIQATGSDGRKYKLSGDINIIRARKSSSYAGDDDVIDDGGDGGEDDGGNVVTE